MNNSRFKKFNMLRPYYLSASIDILSELSERSKLNQKVWNNIKNLLSEMLDNYQFIWLLESDKIEILEEIINTDYRNRLDLYYYFNMSESEFKNLLKNFFENILEIFEDEGTLLSFIRLKEQQRQEKERHQEYLQAIQNINNEQRIFELEKKPYLNTKERLELEERRILHKKGLRENWGKLVKKGSKILRNQTRF